MGIFNRLLSGGGDIPSSSAIMQVQGGAMNPTAPGDLSHDRTVPIIHRQRPLKGEEAEVLGVLASQREALAASSKAGYGAIERIEKSDQAIHEAYRGYQGTVSAVELGKRKADTKYLETLQGQRLEYGELGSRLITAEAKAGQRQKEIKARVNQILNGSRHL